MKRSHKKAVHRSLLADGAFTREHAYSLELMLKGFGYRCKVRAPKFLEDGVRIDSFIGQKRGWRIYDIEHEWLAHLINFLSAWGGAYTIVERLHLSLIAIFLAFEDEETRNEAIDSVLRLEGWGGFYVMLNGIMQQREATSRAWESFMVELTERLMEHAVLGDVQTPHKAFRRANYRGW